MKLIDNCLFWLMTTRVYNWFVKDILPYIRFTTYYAVPNNKNYDKWGVLCHKGYKFLKSGHFILTVDSKKATTLFISSATSKQSTKYDFIPSHAAFCINKYDTDNGIPYEIAEMTHLDYTESTFTDICYESTRVVICECIDWDAEYINNVMIPTILSFSEKKYDRQFIQGLDALACSELVYYADPENRLVVNLDPIIGSRKYISPMGLLNAENIKIVWDSDKAL